MKVLIAGAAKMPAIERYFADHLNQMGIETRLFDAQNLFFDYYFKSILNKISFKIGLSRILHRINDMLLAEVDAMQPDIVWVFKGMELFPETLRRIRAKKIRLVNYNTDNPFVFTGKGSGNKNVTESLPLYDLHLTYDRTIQRRIVGEYGIRCELLPFAFEESPGLYAKCITQEEVRRVCFVGSPDANRAAFLDEVGAAVPLTIYGPGWTPFITNKQIEIKPPVHGDDFWKTLYRYRVQLNFMRTHNPDSHNMRSFEAPGIGAIMLAPATTDHRAYFEENKEIFLFSDTRECIEKAGALLALSTEEASSIRLNARQRSVSSGYSYMGRTRMVSKWLEELYEKNSDPAF